MKGVKNRSDADYWRFSGRLETFGLSKQALDWRKGPAHFLYDLMWRSEAAAVCLWSFSWRLSSSTGARNTVAGSWSFPGAAGQLAGPSPGRPASELGPFSWFKTQHVQPAAHALHRQLKSSPLTRCWRVVWYIRHLSCPHSHHNQRFLHQRPPFPIQTHLMHPRCSAASRPAMSSRMETTSSLTCWLSARWGKGRCHMSLWMCASMNIKDVNDRRCLPVKFLFPSACSRAPDWMTRGVLPRPHWPGDPPFQTRISSASSCVLSPTEWRSSGSRLHPLALSPNPTDVLRSQDEVPELLVPIGWDFYTSLHPPGNLTGPRQGLKVSAGTELWDLIYQGVLLKAAGGVSELSSLTQHQTGCSQIARFKIARFAVWETLLITEAQWTNLIQGKAQSLTWSLLLTGRKCSVLPLLAFEAFTLLPMVFCNLKVYILYCHEQMSGSFVLLSQKKMVFFVLIDAAICLYYWQKENCKMY